MSLLSVTRDHCRLRAWDLRALAVRSNHVHAVIADPEIEPEPIVKQLKEWGTRKLRSHRIIAPRQHAWADHASTVYLYEPRALAAKVDYILTMQESPPEGHGCKDWEVRYGLRES